MKRIEYRSGDALLHKEIVDLLCECFGAKYRDYYLIQLEHLLSPQHTKLLVDDDGHLAAFTQIVDYKLRLQVGEKPLRAAYLYSVCTAERHQGQGVMSHFIREMLRELQSDDYAMAFLVPAEDWLVEYYKRFGFVWQDSVVYEKVPKAIIPLLSPDKLATDYLNAVAKYEGKQLSQHQYEERKSQGWVPLLPAPICWMTVVLTPDLTLPASLVLVNPLT